MIGFFTRALVALGSAAALLTHQSVAAGFVDNSAHKLPVFFFHGITGSAESGRFLQQNLSTDARPFMSLSFCESECSFIDLRTQTQLAINQIRSIVANDTRFARGYSFVAHSQGSAIARSVIENMDDHKVHTFISLGGVANGIFYGPQATDYQPSKFYLEVLAPLVIDPTVFNISQYSVADIPTGRLTIDTIKLQIARPELQSAASIYQVTRNPAKSVWVGYNKFFAIINNLQSPVHNKTIAKEQQRRKCNFLKLKAAHFFGSSSDEIISPWQTSILGKYNDVASMAELEANYSKLKVISAKETDEYKYDTYGLQTLDRRGGLTLTAIDGVGHNCWITDSVAYGRTEECKWKPAFEKSVYPLLKPLV